MKSRKVLTHLVRDRLNLTYLVKGRQAGRSCPWKNASSEGTGIGAQAGPIVQELQFLQFAGRPG